MLFGNRKTEENNANSSLAITDTTEKTVATLVVKEVKPEQPKATLVITDLPTADEVLGACEDAGKLNDKSTVLGTIVSYFVMALPESFIELINRGRGVIDKVNNLIERIADLPEKFSVMQTEYTEKGILLLEGLKADLTEFWRSSVTERGDRIRKIREMKDEKLEVEGDLATHVVRLTGLPNTEKPEPIRGEWAVPLAIVALTVIIDWVLGTDTFAIASNQDISGIVSLVGAVVLAGLGIATGHYLRQSVEAKSAAEVFEAEYSDKGGYSFTAERAGEKVKKLKEAPEDLVTSVYAQEYSTRFNLRLCGSLFLALIVFIAVMRAYIIQVYLEGDWSQFMSTGILFAATAGGFIAKYLLSSPFSKKAMKKWNALVEKLSSLETALIAAEKEEDPFATQAKTRIAEYTENLTELHKEVVAPAQALRDERLELIAEIKTLQVERNFGIKPELEAFTLLVVNRWLELTGSVWLPRPSAKQMGRDFDKHSGWANLDGVQHQLDALTVQNPVLNNPSFSLGELEKELAKQFPLPLDAGEKKAPAKVEAKTRVVPVIRSLAD